MKNKTSFSSIKERYRRLKVGSTNTDRFDTENESECKLESFVPNESGPESDHTYCKALDVQCDLDLYEECVSETSDSWRVGRRIVDLGVLADGLSGCTECYNPLSLQDTIGETKFGLGGYIHVLCRNCCHVNKIPLGKRHQAADGKLKVFDVNSKAAAGMDHIGIGETQLNNLMSAMNIPAVTRKTIKDREREIGPAFESVAVTSTENALQEEISASMQGGTGDPKCSLTLSEDGAWQARGSGRSFSSLSGHACMAGKFTNKIVSYETRIKACRICDHYEKINAVPRKHSCRKNWTGSAKSMEADMVVSMIQNIESNSKSASVGTIVGDEDVTAVARVRREINPEIEKKSDSNHIRKTLGNELYALRKKHKLSTNTIKYFQKNFNYMCHQNRDNPDGVKTGLDAMSRHPFNDHSACDSSWCRHIGNPEAKYTCLPYGKPLSDTALQQSVQSIFNRYKTHAAKLSSMESTQVNENFNAIVASKAPKRQHFSGSESLDYRVSAAASQKNDGYEYLSKVYNKAGLSPGCHTLSRAFIMDGRIRKRRSTIKSKVFKRRRQGLKRERFCQTSASELREGDTYATGICINKNEADMEQIPESIEKPNYSSVTDMEFEKVFFDLETTGLGHHSHITQIAAVTETGRSFNSFVVPKVPIHKQAEKVTGLSCNGKQMFQNGKPVSSLPIHQALAGFFQFIGDKPVILTGHNIKCFDCHVLHNAAIACEFTEKLNEHVHGYVDTLPLFRECFPSLTSYKQECLFQHFVGDKYDAHNASQDAKALKTLFSVAGIQNTRIQKHSFTCAGFMEICEFNNHAAKRMKSWYPLIESSVISKPMAQKAAGSGLQVGHLKLAHQRDADHGVESVLTETLHGKPRVTKSRKILSQLINFFNN